MRLVTNKAKIWYLCDALPSVAAGVTMDNPAVIWLFSAHQPYITIMICATRDAVLQAHMLQSRPVLLERSSHASQGWMICQARRGGRGGALGGTAEAKSRRRRRGLVAPKSPACKGRRLLATE